MARALQAAFAQVVEHRRAKDGAKLALQRVGIHARVARNAVSEEVVRIQQDPTKTIEDVRHLVAGVRGRTNVLGKGDTDDGIWTVGQAQGLIHDIPTVAEMVARVAGEAEAVIARNAARIA